MRIKNTLTDQRDKARKNKDYGLADKLKIEIENEGIEVTDYKTYTLYTKYISPSKISFFIGRFKTIWEERKSVSFYVWYIKCLIRINYSAYKSNKLRIK